MLNEVMSSLGSGVDSSQGRTGLGRIDYRVQIDSHPVDIFVLVELGAQSLDVRVENCTIVDDRPALLLLSCLAGIDGSSGGGGLATGVLVLFRVGDVVVDDHGYAVVEDILVAEHLSGIE